MIDETSSIYKSFLNNLTINSYDYGNYAITTKLDVCDFLHCNIKDVKVIVPNKVIQVTFEDGDRQKVVCEDEDTYNFEVGVTICIMKHVLGAGTYNRLLRNAKKIVKENTKKQEEEKERKEIEKRHAAKREARKQRRKEARKEEAIEVQKEAYIRAMEYIANN